MLGLTGVVLRAAGCAFPKPLPEPLSLWTFDETGGTSFADSGPANVPMAIIGTWADLSTGSMVQGIGGTSAYTSGSGYATIPANDPDHNLSGLTISFYYQRDSAAAKHILLAAGDGAQVGDFSIEFWQTGVCAVITLARTHSSGSLKARMVLPAPICRSAPHTGSTSPSVLWARGSIWMASR